MSKELGMDVPPYRFIYTYAVWLAMKNIPPNVLKEFLAQFCKNHIGNLRPSPEGEGLRPYSELMNPYTEEIRKV